MNLHILSGIFFVSAMALYLIGSTLGSGLFFLGFLIEIFAWITFGAALENKDKDK